MIVIFPQITWKWQRDKNVCRLSNYIAMCPVITIAVVRTADFLSSKLFSSSRNQSILQSSRLLYLFFCSSPFISWRVIIFQQLYLRLWFWLLPLSSSYFVKYYRVCIRNASIASLLAILEPLQLLCIRSLVRTVANFGCTPCW